MKPSRFQDRRIAKTEQDCRNNVRWTLSDRTRGLCFETLDIVDAADRAETAPTLSHYRVGRAHES